MVEVDLSAIFGIALPTLLVPFQVIFSMRTARELSHMTIFADQRAQKMNEVISATHFIKFSAWKCLFLIYVEDLRHTEVGNLRSATTIRSVNSSLFDLSSIPVSLITFSPHTMLFDRRLTRAITFSTISFYVIMSQILKLMPFSWLSVSETSLPLKRFDAFFDLPELPSVPDSIRLDVRSVLREDRDALNEVAEKGEACLPSSRNADRGNKRGQM